MVTNEDQSVDSLKKFAEELIRDAGKEALAFYGKGKKEMRFDRDLVTKAELRLMDFLQKALLSQYPNHQIFDNALKDTEYTHEEKRYLWVYDPLDGVSNYQAGVPMWGISLALQENFWPIFGMFYMPATNELFQATAGEKGAVHKRKSKDIRELNQVNDESILYVFSRFHQHFKSDFPGKILNLGCTSLHLCYVANGHAEAAIILNESFQSLAAVRVIVETSGAKFFEFNGNEVFLNEYLAGQKIEQPLIVTTPDLFPLIRSHIQEVRQ